jgi:hypothetical protein
MSLPDWWPSWTGDTRVIVASGPSAKDVPIDQAKGRARFIVTNSSWKLAPWADILFACDQSWWKHYSGCPEFSGLKLTTDSKASAKFPEVRHVNCRKPDDRLVLKPLGTVGWGSNSGFQALNLAVQFGCAKIILVGFDMRLDKGLHWHGRHPDQLSNPSVRVIDRWRRSVDNAWGVIKPTGCRVINCSPISALKAYPKMTFEDALAEGGAWQNAAQAV